MHVAAVKNTLVDGFPLCRREFCIALNVANFHGLPFMGSLRSHRSMATPFSIQAGLLTNRISELATYQSENIGVGRLSRALILPSAWRSGLQPVLPELDRV